MLCVGALIDVMFVVAVAHPEHISANAKKNDHIVVFMSTKIRKELLVSIGLRVTLLTVSEMSSLSPAATL